MDVLVDRCAGLDVHKDTVMAVWESYRSGELAETNGPVVPETSPFRPKPRRVPVAVGDDAGAPTIGEVPIKVAASESAGDADRV